MATFALQPLMVTVLIAGFVHASRIPAGLRGNATFALSWSEQSGAWTDGVKKAGLVLAVLVPIAALFPLHVITLGPSAAGAHAIIVGTAGLCLLELALLFGYGTVPFVSRYEPLKHALAIAPIYIALTCAAVFLFAVAVCSMTCHGLSIH